MAAARLGATTWAPTEGATNPNRPLISRLLAVPALLVLCACGAPGTETASYDLILRGGTVYDGSGGPALQADVAITDDRVAAIGELWNRQ